MFNEEVGSQATFVFDNSHELDTSDGMFHPYPNTGNLPVELFFFFRKCFSLSFFDGLYDRHLFGCISLMSSVLIQDARDPKRIHRVCHLLVMCFTANGLDDKENQTRYSNQHGILYCMTFLFPAVLLFLFIRVKGTRKFPFQCRHGAIQVQ